MLNKVQLYRTTERAVPSVVRRIHVALAAVVAAGSLAACQAQEQQRAEQRETIDTAAITAIVDSLRSAYEKAVAAGDFDAMARIVAEDAVMVGPGGPEWESMREAASARAFPPGATIDISPIELVVLNEEWAYEFGTSIVSYTPEGAKEGRQLRDTYLILLRDAGDGWKAYREVASSSPPPEGWPGK